MNAKEIAERLAEAHDRMAVLEGVDNDDLYIILVAATAIAQARAEALREAAKVAEDAALSHSHPLGNYDKGFRNAATGIARGIRALQGGER